MPGELSKNKIDRLGARLRVGPSTDEDLALLDAYRRSFRKPHLIVSHMLYQNLSVDLVGRPSKTTESIIAKLNRESVRLSQIQDIAGCRVVVPDIVDQNRQVAKVSQLFQNAHVVDRRLESSHGYRAVHLIVDIEGKAVEIQIRSMLQHLWAQCSERLADLIDPTIKYGGGPPKIRRDLDESSKLIALMEHTELDFNSKGASPEYAQLEHVIRRELETVRGIRKKYAEHLRKVLSNLSEKHDDFLD